MHSANVTAGRVVALGLGVLVLVLVVGCSRSAGGTSPAPAAPVASATSLPGNLAQALGGIGGAVGTVVSNSAGLLVLDDGTEHVDVTITPQTKLVSVDGGAVSWLPVGATVVVQGGQLDNGRMRADTIITTTSLNADK